MIHTTRELPGHYRLKMTVNLAADRRLSGLLSLGSLLLAVGLALLGFGLHPVEAADLAEKPLRWLVCLAGLILYTLLRGLIQGGMICLLGKVKPDFGFNGGFFYAGCPDAYFCRSDYALLGLAPVLLMGSVLLVLNLTLPEFWFWPVYVIQIFNLGGASGALFMIWLSYRRNLRGALIRDTGRETEYYMPRKVHPER